MTVVLGRSSPGVAIGESVLPLVSAPSSTGPTTEATQPAHVDPPADDRPRVALVGAHGRRPTDERLPLGCAFAMPPKVLYGHAARLRWLAA